MRKRTVLLAFLSLLAACASAGGGRGAVYQREIGNATRTDALSRSFLILTRNHYEVFEQDSLPFIRIESHWRTRPPFADEQALGITGAESRVIITARSRSETDIGSVYNVRMAVENRVRLGDSPEWSARTDTDMFRRYADEMIGQFRTELINIGVRRY